MVTTTLETTRKYSAEGIQDTAWRISTSPNATMIIHSPATSERSTACSMALVGGRQRFQALFDLLDSLLADWPKE